jgi:hypothetical protein
MTIGDRMVLFPTKTDFEISAGSPRRAFFSRGYFSPPSGSGCKRCVLVLTGTSTNVADVACFISRLRRCGSAVAAVERFIGGPLAFFIRPSVERPAALKHFMGRLYKDFGITDLDVVAHSYAAQEVVRVFDGRPATSFPRIGTITLINPSGFGNTRGFFAHCLRFVFLFILRDYYHNRRKLKSYEGTDEVLKGDCRRVMVGLRTLLIKTIANPIRTIKEVADIVTCDLRPAARRLVLREGRRLLVFLSRRDTLVSADKTRDFFHHALPSVPCIDLPGNHLDPVLREACIQVVVNTIRKEGA